MKKAFTMIELIFVIVIIGIVSSIAIPKMTATRDDAIIAAIVSKTKIIVQDVNTFYTSQGEDNYLITTVTAITDVPLYTDSTCTTAVVPATLFAGTLLYLCDDSGDVLDINSTNTAGSAQSITLKQGTSTSTINATLSRDSAFLALTNSTIGKTTKLGGQKVSR